MNCELNIDHTPYKSEIFLRRRQATELASQGRHDGKRPVKVPASFAQDQWGTSKTLSSSWPVGSYIDNGLASFLEKCTAMYKCLYYKFPEASSTRWVPVQFDSLAAVEVGRLCVGVAGAVVLPVLVQRCLGRAGAVAQLVFVEGLWREGKMT